MNVLDYFNQICRIPHNTGSEEPLREYIRLWASDNQLLFKRDSIGNLIIKANPTVGYENFPTIALQAHLDMVCVKTPDSKHDFSKDEIKTYIDGDYIKARETSLGADNGIGVALAMALLTDSTLKHGPLEAIFTFYEEEGMLGAKNIDASLIEGKYLINLDGKDEGTLCIGCAGGTNVFASKEFVKELIPDNWEVVTIKLFGLKGGHSGEEIHRHRLNAIVFLSEILAEINLSGIPLMLMDFQSGYKRNVIPSNIQAGIAIKTSDKKAFEEILHKRFNDYCEEYSNLEKPVLAVNYSPKEKMDEGITYSESTKIIRGLASLPNGLISYHKSYPDVVETSLNLAIAKMDNNKFCIELSIRSLFDYSKQRLGNKCKYILDSFGFETQVKAGHLVWMEKNNSKLTSEFSKAYKSQTGKDCKITLFHGGLECGYLSKLIPNVECINIGPNIEGCHSIDEKVSISSTQRTYLLLKQVLENIN